MLLIAVVALAIVMLRVTLVRDERRWQAFLQRWRPRMLGWLVEPGNDALPPLPTGDRLRFLRLWLYLHESVRGEAAQHLNVAARTYGIDGFARRLLNRGSRTERLQAVLALGHLRDVPAWDGIARLATLKDPLLSMNAARALVQIDPMRAAEALTPTVLRRDDWDVARTATFTADARDAFGLMLAQRLPGLPVRALPRALRLARAMRIVLPLASLQRLLRQRQEAGVLQEVLPLLRGPGLREEVLRALQHPHPAVRAAALRALATMAVPVDVPEMQALLQDPDAAVRLASARALVQLPFVPGTAWEDLAMQAGIGQIEMRHALAERDWRVEAA